MARLTSEQRELILADFHTGQYSQHKLAQKHKVSSKTINTIVKGIEAKHTDKVNTIVSMRASLLAESKHEVNAVDREIEERTRHLVLFQNSGARNQVVANKILTQLEDKEDISVDDLNHIEAHSRITQKNKEIVLGKDKTVDITNTNAQQNNFNEIDGYEVETIVNQS